MARDEREGRDGGATPGRRDPAWPLVGLAGVWIFLCLFGVAPVSLLVEGFASIAGNPALASDTLFTAAAECLFYLVMAFAVFRVGRRFGMPFRAWPIGPLGYLMSVALATLGMWLVLLTDAMPRGVAWAFIVADLAATAAGAWVGLRPDGDVAMAEPEAA